LKKFGLRITFGVVLFSAVIAVLISSYQELFLHGIWMIDTELNESGGSAFFVRTKMDFGESTHVESLVPQINQWYSTGDYDWDYIKEALGADAMLVRGYTRSDIYQVVFLLLAQSNDLSSFHPPPVCFRAQGYEIEEERTVSFPVGKTEWAASHWRSEAEGNVFKGGFDAKLVVISKKSVTGEVNERMAVLYYYVKHGKVLPDKITMVQVSTQVPIDTSYERGLELLKELMGDSIPVMFEPEKIETEATAMVIVHKYGAFGYLMIVGALMLPIVIAVFPVRLLKISWILRFLRKQN